MAKKNNTEPRISEYEKAGKKLQKVTLYTTLRKWCEATATLMGVNPPEVIRRSLTVVAEAIKRGIINKNLEFTCPDGNVQEDINSLSEKFEQGHNVLLKLIEENIALTNALIGNAPLDSVSVRNKTEEAVSRAFVKSDVPRPERPSAKENSGVSEEQMKGLQKKFAQWRI